MAFHIPEIIKKHPWWFAGGGVVLFIIIYYLSSSSSSDTGSGATDASTLAYDEQQNQLAAAESIAGIQAQAQTQAVQAQAGVQSQAISASQEVTDNQTAASLQAYLANSNNSLSAVQSTNQTQVQLAQVQSNEQDTVVNGLASIVGDQYQAQENQENDVASVLENQTNVQGAVASQAIGVQGAAVGDQYALDSQTLNLVQSGQLNKGGTGGQEQIAAVGAATGNPAIGVAAATGGAQTAVSGNNLTAGVVNSLTSLGSSALDGLVG